MPKRHEAQFLAKVSSEARLAGFRDMLVTVSPGAHPVVVKGQIVGKKKIGPDDFAIEEIQTNETLEGNDNA